MMPPMKQTITFGTVKKDSGGQPLRDKYGRPIGSVPEQQGGTPQTHPARVTREVSIVRDEQGTERTISLEIDVPPHVEPDIGAEIRFTTVSGKEEAGTIVAIRETTNLAGDRVYFRTLYVDG